MLHLFSPPTGVFFRVKAEYNKIIVYANLCKNRPEEFYWLQKSLKVWTISMPGCTEY